MVPKTIVSANSTIAADFETFFIISWQAALVKGILKKFLLSDNGLYKKADKSGKLAFVGFLHKFYIRFTFILLDLEKLIFFHDYFWIIALRTGIDMLQWTCLCKESV